MTPTIHTAKPPGWQSEQNPSLNLLAPFGPQLEQFTKPQLLWLLSKGQRKLRFSGLTDSEWSINHHLLLCAYLYPPAMWHDSHEAFTGDWPTPVKPYIYASDPDEDGGADFKRFADIEHRAQVAIERFLGAAVNPHLDKIKETDRLALQIEDAALKMGIFQESVISPQNMMLFNRVNELTVSQAADKWLGVAMEMLFWE